MAEAEADREQRPAPTTRGIVPATVAVAAGAVVVGLAPMFGLPLVAFGLAWFAYRDRTWLAVALCLVAGAAFAAVDLPTAVLVTIGMLTVGPLAAALVRERSPLAVVCVAALGYAFAQWASLAVEALQVGRSVLDAGRLLVERVVPMWTEAFAQTMTAVQAAELLDILEPTFLRMWPSVLVLTGAMIALPTVVAVVVSGAIAGAKTRRFPRLADIDIHPAWVVVPLIGFGARLASRLLGQPEGVLDMIGLNLVLVVWPVFFVQGFAVLAGMYRKLKAPLLLRAFGYVLLFGMELRAPVGAIVGALDVWLNFRRLPRRRGVGRTIGEENEDADDRNLEDR